LARASGVVTASLLAAGVFAGCSRETGPDRGAGAGNAQSIRGGQLVASQRTEPASYNRYFEATAAAELVTQLTQAKLVRVNRSSDEVEPGLAESWSTTDGLTYSVKLRPNVRFSDGAPFSSADVVFSFQAAQESAESVLASGLRVGGKPLTVVATDPGTVTITFPHRFAPAIRLLDNLPILPRHKLLAAFEAKTLKDAWTPAKPASEVVGLGPFVLSEHVSGQRLVLTRNPHYWRRDRSGTALPYLDKVTLLLVPDQSAEVLRLEAGATDLMANADTQPENYGRLKQLSAAGKLHLIDGGVGLDANVCWFNLKAKPGDGKPWLRRKEFRQALSYAVDRQAIANSVYLGAAQPVYGPVTPRNRTWFSGSAPTYPYDSARARQLLASIGLRDRDGNGTLDDGAGRPVRFSVLIRQGGALRERTASVLQEQLRAVGVGLDIVGLDMGAIVQRWQKGDYDSVFHGFDVSATDPALNLDFWLSSGSLHFWNPLQPSPATEWERRIDDLMQRQATTAALEERQRLFAEVQRIFGEELPALYFVVPVVTLAASPRVQNLVPAAQNPHFLWNADSIAVTAPVRPPQ
jgi:peptide/nickel transport system substrate-binding protein